MQGRFEIGKCGRRAIEWIETEAEMNPSISLYPVSDQSPKPSSLQGNIPSVVDMNQDEWFLYARVDGVIHACPSRLIQRRHIGEAGSEGRERLHINIDVPDWPEDAMTYFVAQCDHIKIDFCLFKEDQSILDVFTKSVS
jgi:hypothetical protein